MSLFLRLVGFEVSYYMRRISTHVYFVVLGAVMFAIFAAMTGAFKNVDATVGGAGGIVKANSPHVLGSMIGAMSLFGIIVTAALVGHAAYRDFQEGIHPLVFTCPIPKRVFLASRFVGSLLVNAYVYLGLLAGALLASVMPWVDAERMGPFRLDSYFYPYLVVILPNLVFVGAIFFALGSLTRQALPNYLGGALLFVGYLMASILVGEIDNETVASLLDPFGMISYGLVSKYWTPSEKNTQLVPLAGVFLANRALWMGVGLAVLATAASLFRFAHLPWQPDVIRRIVERLRPSGVDRPETVATLPHGVVVPQARRSFTAGAHLRQLAAETSRAFLGIVRNVYFAAIVGAGILFLLVTASQVGKLYGTTTWPVTYQVLEVLGGSFALVTVIVVTFYSGELVWRERQQKVAQVHDALPTPTWVPFLGKLVALVLVVMSMQAVLLATGIATQASKGYTNFELDLYARELFVHGLLEWAPLCVLALTIHVLVNNLYLGHFIVILYYVAAGFMGSFGLQHNLYRYGSDPGMQYSDMNAYGPFMVPYLWFKLYWAAVAVLLAVVSNLAWTRGSEGTLQWRLRLARMRFRRPVAAVTVAAGALALAVGGFIFYNTNVLNEYRTSGDEEALQARYEREHAADKELPQPRVVAASVEIDLHPREQDAEVRGTYRLRNKTQAPLSQVLVRLPPEIEVRRLELSSPATIAREVPDFGLRYFELERPMAPGEEIDLIFDVALETTGFSNSRMSTDIVENGTFLNNLALPRLGYGEEWELSDDDTRREHGLPPKERMAAVDDVAARGDTYIASDADWVDFEATVSTDPDQIAIAPGYLQREWSEGGRRFFHYRMDAPILHFWSVLSARYEVKEDRWNDVALAVYYQRGHEYNVDRMLTALKKSLDYFTREFGPYQHRQVRILEFPRYAQFAQSFPNTIPYSESIGFIARLDEETDIDYPFYVTAHELAHQWFAHQVIGGNVQGSTLMSETLAQYGALMVLEDEYGPEHMRKFLRYELERYLIGRATERKKELPLALNENQQYIHYAKGSLVTYALKDYLGEAVFNSAIREYVQRVKFQEPPYTNSIEFVEAVRAVTPPELQYLIDDLFMTITLLDNRTTSATSKRLPDGRYDVTIEIETKKVRADEDGDETEVPMSDMVDVGVFAEDVKSSDHLSEPLHFRKHRLKTGKNTIHVIVNDVPVRAGVDPYHKLIDRHLDDNVVEIKPGES